MSTPTKGNGAGLGSILMSATKLTLRAALNNVTSNSSIINYVASKMYVDETGGDWSKLGTADRALWQQRVRNVVMALADTVAI